MNTFRCSGVRRPKGRFETFQRNQCSRRGVHRTADGRWWCVQHHPEHRKARKAQAEVDYQQKVLRTQDRVILRALEVAQALVQETQTSLDELVQSYRERCQ